MTYTLVSMPDFFNADVADLRGLKVWQPGMPNGVNDTWRRAIDVCLDEVEAEHPDAVLVAGDQVEGHWDVDSDNDQMFGPVGTWDEKNAAVRKAAPAYYGFYKSLFTQRGLTLYPALGDHEIGDDRMDTPVNERWPPDSWRYQAVDTYKDEWANAFTRNPDGTYRYDNRPDSAARGTAYALDLPGSNITLLTVDCFAKTPNGVELEVAWDQGKWVEAVLTDANTRGRIVIAQGHVPIMWPVRLYRSGGLHLAKGMQSPFWDQLVAHRVPLYLCGEVHAVTATAPPGKTTQVAHGSLFGYGFNYLRIDVAGDGSMQLTAKEVVQTTCDATSPLWSSHADKRPPGDIVYQRGAVTTGTMHLASDGTVIARDGNLAPYRP